MNKTNRRIDLHIHSIASDGTDTIPMLLENLRASGIGIFSVTDHDTITGALEMQELVPGDMTFIKGIEFSCVTSAGKCHILGYGYDENAPEFQAVLEEGRTKRRAKLERRIDFLRDNFGIVFSEEELSALHSMNSVGKPHLGNLLVSKGYADSKDSAIRKFIDPCKTESERLDGEKVISAVLSAGGVPVWAHPLGGTGERLLSEEEFSRQLALLKAAGLKGLECYYSRYSEEQVQFLLGSAKSNGLYISGGSDYHGQNKTVQLGELNAFGKVIFSDLITLPMRI